LDVLYGGLGLSKLQVLIRKKRFVVLFSSAFGHQNLGSGLDPDPNTLEMLDPDPYPDILNTEFFCSELLFLKYG
jgi:hypothetical protein